MSSVIKPIPRYILAKFLEDQDAIKLFEKIQQNAGNLLPTEVATLLRLSEEAFFSADQANTRAVQAIAAFNDIARAVETLALAPTLLPAIEKDSLDPSRDFFPEQAPYGEMYATNISVAIVVAAANTAYEVTSGMTGGLEYLMAFGGAHYIQAERGGIYLANWSLSIDTAGALDEIEGGLMIGGVAQNNGTAHTTVAAAADASTVAANALLQIAAGDQISLFVRNHTAARDITVEHASLTLTRIRSN